MNNRLGGRGCSPLLAVVFSSHRPGSIPFLGVDWVLFCSVGYVLMKP